MDVNMMVNGKQTTCMVLVHILGKMVACIKVSTKMARGMVMVSTFGPTVKSK